MWWFHWGLDEHEFTTAWWWFHSGLGEGGGFTRAYINMVLSQQLGGGYTVAWMNVTVVASQGLW